LNDENYHQEYFSLSKAVLGRRVQLRFELRHAAKSERDESHWYPSTLSKRQRIYVSKTTPRRHYELQIKS